MPRVPTGETSVTAEALRAKVFADLESLGFPPTESLHVTASSASVPPFGPAQWPGHNRRRSTVGIEPLTPHISHHFVRVAILGFGRYNGYPARRIEWWRDTGPRTRSVGRYTP